MATTEERLQILRMIEEGKITAKEGAELLRAIDANNEEPDFETYSGINAPRWFRVRVTDLRSGRNKINVNVPIGLVKVGIKMGARFVPNIEGVEYQKLLAAVQSGKQGKVIDVTDSEGGERVEIFME